MLASGDLVVIASDGVVDILGPHVIKNYLELSLHLNPQTIAEELVSLATQNGSTTKDDTSALCFRIYQV